MVWSHVQEVRQNGGVFGRGGGALDFCFAFCLRGAYLGGGGALDFFCFLFKGGGGRLFDAEMSW